jgi:hypothetical protein
MSEVGNVVDLRRASILVQRLRTAEWCRTCVQRIRLAAALRAMMDGDCPGAPLCIGDCAECDRQFSSERAA